MLKMILILITFLNLTSCNLFLGIPIGEKIQYLPFKPVSVFIDDNNNGVISTTKAKIYEIDNLNIESEIIGEKGNFNYEPIYVLNYYSNKANNSKLFYLYFNSVVGENNSYINSIELKNNVFIKDSNKELLSFQLNASSSISAKITDFIKTNQLHIFNISDSIWGLSYPDFIPKVKTMLFNNEKKYDFEVINNDSNSKIIDSYIDENGNGWLILSGYSKKIIYNKISNYSLSSLKELGEANIFNHFIKSYLNKDGTGFIIFTDENNYSSNIQKYKDFKLIPEPNLSSYDLVQATHFNKEGNGIAIISKEIKNSNDTDYYHYLKKISNYNLDSKEIRFLDNSKFKYLDSFINEKGNGLVFFRKDGESNCIVKKILNYEVEK